MRTSQPPPIDELFPPDPARRRDAAAAPTDRSPTDRAALGRRSVGRLTDDDERPALTHLRVAPWPDPVIDRLGIDPRSDYVEQYWLGIVGPASVLFVRHLAARFDAEPDGFELDLAHTARLLGLGTALGRWGPVQRTIHRCISFGFARRWGDDQLLARRRLPPATRQQLARLPEDRQADHERWRAELLQAPSLPR